MMRTVVVVGLVAAVANATPAPRAIVASMVRIHLTAVGTDHWHADEIGLPDDVLLYMPLGLRGVYGSDGETVRGPGMAFWHDVENADSVGIGRVDVVVSGDVAWFQADYHLDGKATDAGPPAYHDPQHAAGIALHGPSGWRLQAIGYSELASDHDLVTGQPRFNSDKLPTDPPKLSGDSELAKAAASWIANGFTGHGATAGTLASGSAPGEIASDADVATLVKGWDGLGLRASSIEATVLRGGNAGFVHAEVAFPIKGTKRAAPLHLNLGAIREADGWRWTVLAYGAPALR
jgi:ketosteroid isomerase-like protein